MIQEREEVEALNIWQKQLIDFGGIERMMEFVDKGVKEQRYVIEFLTQEDYINFRSNLIEEIWTQNN